MISSPATLPGAGTAVSCARCIVRMTCRPPGRLRAILPRFRPERIVFRVPSLRDLCKEAWFRQQPEPLHGRHQAALRAQPAADPDPARRFADPCLRLHALPQERPGHQGRLDGSAQARRPSVKLDGIHHVTCITADAPRNVDFYTRVMGLRMVKKTVNQDDPTVYHLFYADERGSAGSDITF